ncbi:hypothetical protein OS493_014081 [Desmophyllum pertusum]|uniref:Transmembrane protein n=1 Tax=Desmophyllum pertusum TaxID=174260 RepID=A0A9X0CXK3_9CNID|nr:hypothetical protein OS493_014081 [Desmophyllum pertusum]
MLASCFKDKAKKTVLQKCRPFMIFQCILHLTLLALNTNEAVKAFGNDQGQKWCGTNSVLMTSVGFVMTFNILAILAIEDHTILCLKREVSPAEAMAATLVAGMISCGVLFWAGVLSVEGLCSSHIASIVACSLLWLLTSWVLWRICTQVELVTRSTETSLLLDFLNKNKMAVFFSALIVVCIILIIILDVISSVVSSFEQTEEEFQDIKSFERVIYLYVMCFAAGVALPSFFQQLLDSSDNGSDEKVLMEFIPV